MPKRKVTFQGVGSEDEEDETSAPKKKLVDPVAGAGGPGSRFKGKHSLDSDEEDEEEEGSSKYDILASEDVEGQEAATLPSEGGVRITPFNLQEEMEDGHFDADGNYFLNQDAQIRDSWLDNIDWVKIRERPPGQRSPSDSEEEDSLGQTPMSAQALLEGLLELLLPRETVAGALRRLGARGGGKGDSKGPGRPSSPQRLDRLCGLADQMVARGNLGVYQETRERLAMQLKGLGCRTQGPPDPMPKPSLDMFAEEVAEGELETPTPVQRGEAESPGAGLLDVMWEYKWENTGDAKLYGPFTSSQMQVRPAVSVVMEMTLLLLFLGGVWAQEVDMEATPTQPSFSLAPTISEASNLISVVSDDATTAVSEAHGSAGHQAILPSSAPDEVPSPETSVAAHVSLMADAVTTQIALTRKLLMSQEIANATSDPTVPARMILGLHTEAGETMATSSLETSTGTSGLPVTMATTSLETSSGMLTSESPVTMTTSSLETSDVTSGPPITMATSSLDTSNGTSGLPVTMATSSLDTSNGTSGSPVSRVRIVIMSTPAVSTDRGSGPAQSSEQKTSSTLMVAVLVALLAVILLALVLLWRRRQKRRTGALTLNRAGKHNGVVDPWAGPARVSDEEAVITAAAGVSGDKGAGIPEGEGSGSGSGRRPTLTTFFDRRKSRQGSLALEELKAEPAAGLTGEEEPLVGSEDGDEEAPAAGGPGAGDVEAPECV